MATGPDIEKSLEAARADRSFFGHPRGLATLFFTEMWERFSYYGMRALLILYMTAGAEKGGLGFAVPKAGAVYGLYTAMIYLLSLPGGWVADRLTGQRRAVLYGGILIALGQFFLVAPGILFFYLGLVVLVLGTGLLKPNVSTIVGQIYAPGDARRDSGFSIFYMGINLGALLSPLACGWVGEKINWRLGFGLAGVCMIAGVIQYVLGAKYLGSAGLYPATPPTPEEARRQKRRAAFGALAGLAVFGGLVIAISIGRISECAQNSRQFRHYSVQTARKPATKQHQVLLHSRGHANGERPCLAGRDDANHQPALEQKKRAAKNPFSGRCTPSEKPDQVRGRIIRYINTSLIDNLAM